MSYLFQFGAYQLPRGFYPDQEQIPQTVPMQQIPRKDGSASLPGQLNERRIRVKGGLALGQVMSTGGAPITDVRAAADTVKAALLGQGMANLQLDDDRLLRNVQVENLIPSYDSAYGRYAFFTWDFVTGDPFFYATAAAPTDTWAGPAGGGTHTVTNAPPNGGDAYVLPAITLTLAAAGAAVNLRVDNLSTGQYFTFAGTPTRAVITIDSLAQSVIYDNGDDAMALFDWQFLRLAPGANTLQLTPNGIQGTTLSSLATTWTPRWY